MHPHPRCAGRTGGDRKSTRLNSSHLGSSYAVFCLKKKSRAEEDLPVAVIEVAAGRLAAAGRHTLYAGAVDVHDVLLVARASVARGLEDQACAVCAEVVLGVAGAERELTMVGEVLGLARGWRRVGTRGGGRLRGNRNRRRETDRSGVEDFFFY